MRKFIVLALLPVLFSVYPAGGALADVNIGVTADRDGIKEFHLSVGEYYGVRERDVEIVRERSLTDDEIAVVFYLSNRLEVHPITLVELRLGGMSWMDITLKYGLNAEIFYVKYSASPGPPYGKAWGHFNKTPRKEWNKIRLDDGDIISLVNLRFLAEKHQCSPDRIIRMVKEGGSFSGLHKQFKAEKEAKKQQKASAKGTGENKGKGKK